MRRSFEFSAVDARRWVRRKPACLANGVMISMLGWFALFGGSSFAQSAPPATADPKQSATTPDQQRIVEIEHRLNDLTNAISQTQQMLNQSLEEMKELRSQLDALRAQTGGAPASGANAAPATVSAGNEAGSKKDLETIREGQEAMQAEIQQHDQTKVETASKYPVRISGLILFNAFSNAGVVDDVQLPTIALARPPGESHGSSGATLRQTLLALDATGPRIGGARSSAEVSIDFFGGVSANSYGYSSSAGFLRMRQSWVNLEWQQTSAQVGYTVPLISPLSPTSYATVAQPGLAGAGNLWTWSPQAQVEHRFDLSDQHTITLEGGLIDPQSPSYAADQLDSPVEASQHPGYEGRLSYRSEGSRIFGSDHPLVLGVGGYTANQLYTTATQIRSWAATADWQLPIMKWLDLTGEVYRGRALGGFGGGIYRDVLMGTDSVTGQPRTTGVETAGGWSQLKFSFNPTLEANAAFGLDDAFSGNYYGLIFPTGTSASQFTTRNNSIVANLIYRPKTYLILSPEYRHIQTWQFAGPANTAHIFTLTLGYQF
jgi:hypothetical protein